MIIGGIADNEQLRALLADRLVTKMKALQGTHAPSPELVQVLEGSGPAEREETITGIWNLYE